MLQVRGLHSLLHWEDFCEEKYRDTPNNVHTELQQHTCIALKTKLKLHHAQLSSAPNFSKLHSSAATKIE